MSRRLTVALIGPDGAGKSTIGRKLEQVPSLSIKYMYMGVNLESSNMVLPTTRLFLELKRATGQRPDMSTRPVDYQKSRAQTKRGIRRLFASLKNIIRFANLAAEEWFRQGVVWYYKLRGFHVVLDRHFYFDYYAYDIVNTDPKRSILSHLHGFMLKNLYPKPDFVIFLDAPTDVLFARKPEGTIEARESRRQEYIHLREAANSRTVVDVSQPLDKVIQEISELILNFQKKKNNIEQGKQWSV